MKMTIPKLPKRLTNIARSQSGKSKKKRIVFHTHNLGVPLDNLTRDFYYSIDER